MSTGEANYLTPALDLVGDHATLLVARQLLAGPRAYAELRAELPGLPADQLTERLAALVRAGLVAVDPPTDQHSDPRSAAPAGSGQRYELSDSAGRLRDAMFAVARLGLRVMPEPRAGAEVDADSLALALRAIADQARAPRTRERYEFTLNPASDGQQAQRLTVTAGPSVLDVQVGPSPEPPAVRIAGTGRTLLRIGAGQLDLAEARATGEVWVDGDGEALDRLADLLGLAPRESPKPTDIPAGELLLRVWSEEYAEDVLRAFGDAEITRWNPAPVTDHDEAVTWIRNRADWSDGDHASFAVTDTQSGRLLGDVSLHSVDERHSNAEIGYWMLPEARGRSVAARAVDAVCRWAFETLGLARIELVHAVGNPASGRVAEKAGFVREAHLRSSYRYGDGELHDEMVWARFPPES